ncbi:MAG: hypothetical protein EBR82_70790 [Caulobacteraceae bacterium]|nr:hypothetical protein [Caulobacteraceae bacterium]
MAKWQVRIMADGIECESYRADTKESVIAEGKFQATAYAFPSTELKLRIEKKDASGIYQHSETIKL